MSARHGAGRDNGAVDALSERSRLQSTDDCHCHGHLLDEPTSSKVSRLFDCQDRVFFGSGSSSVMQPRRSQDL